MDNYGILSLAPALIAVILAFITREALFSILCGVLVGLLITGTAPRPSCGPWRRVSRIRRC